LLINRGESRTLEFKETLSLDVRSNTKERYVEDMSLKTVAAFLNTEGGVLLIGVNDCGESVGLEKEIQAYHKGSDDKFLLHFTHILYRSVGEHWLPLMDYFMVDISGRKILKVICQPADKPCFINKEAEFYVRSNPATARLEGRKQYEYIRQRFEMGLPAR